MLQFNGTYSIEMGILTNIAPLIRCVGHTTHNSLTHIHTQTHTRTTSKTLLEKKNYFYSKCNTIYYGITNILNTY